MVRCPDRLLERFGHGQRAPLPFLSSLVDDCIAKGKSLQEGGAHYNFTGPQGVGVANVADSLAAIRKLVYEDKAVSLADLKQALATDFAGVEGETLRQMLLNRAPKYGNDEPYADEIAHEGALIYCKEVEKYTNPRGGTFQPGLYPVSANVPLGAVVGATPDGRKAGAPLADGVSPVSGMRSACNRGLWWRDSKGLSPCLRRRQNTPPRTIAQSRRRTGRSRRPDRSSPGARD